MKFTKELEVAVQAAKEAGDEIAKHFHNFHGERARFSLEVKESRDSSSEDDKKIGNILKPRLTKAFPDFGYYSEEKGQRIGGRYQWTVDETDGTTQKAMHIPYFSIAIGLNDTKLRKTVLSVVYNPITGEMFTTAESGKAYCHNLLTGEKHVMRVGNSTDFKQMIILFNPNLDVPPAYETYHKIYRKLFDGFRITPILFSSDLDLTRVADGLAGAVVSARTAPYDHVGSLIVENAGGLVVGPDGKKFDPMRRGIIAANSKKTLKRLEDLGVVELCKQIDNVSPR